GQRGLGLIQLLIELWGVDLRKDLPGHNPIPDVHETALEVAVGPGVDRSFLDRLDGARKRELRDRFAPNREDHVDHRHPIFHGAGGGLEIMVPSNPRQGASAHQPDDPDQHDDAQPGDGKAPAAQADRARHRRPDRRLTYHVDLLLEFPCRSYRTPPPPWTLLPPGTAAAAGAGCR